MDITIPGYTITGVLGKGGMGSVFLAVQQSLKRQVALKIMSPALLADPTFGERFLREAKINSRLMHHNIVTVYDVGVYDSHHYMAMEYIPGVDLRKKKYDLSLTQSLDVITQIASALDFASRKGYVHRDVKPENIMLHEEDERAVLMDFGIARAADSSTSMTMTGTALGTPRYMSPEQAQGENVDGRSDVYSLGVVLFVMLTGHVPFDAESSVAIGIKHITEAIPRLPPMYEAFQGIIDKVLAKPADDRYQNGQEFKNAINAISDDVIAEISAKRESGGFGAKDNAPAADELDDGGEISQESNPISSVSALRKLSANSSIEPLVENTNSSRIIEDFVLRAGNKTETQRTVQIPRQGSSILTVCLIAISDVITDILGRIFSSYRLTETPLVINTKDDRPIRHSWEDTFGYTDYSEALAGIINQANRQASLTICINSKYGKGKTSLANLTEEILLNRMPELAGASYVSEWFESKAHSGRKDLSKMFVADICRKLHRKLPWFKKIIFPLPAALCPPDEIANRNRLKVCLLILLSVTFAQTITPALKPEKLDLPFVDFLDLAQLDPMVSGLLALVSGAVLIMRTINRGLNAISGYLKPTDDISVSDEFDKMREEIEQLVNRLRPRNGKFVLFVDDLERCGSQNISDVLEIIPKLLNFDRTVVVFLTDAELLMNSYDLANEDRAKSYNKQNVSEVSFAREYLRKNIELQFDLPERGRSVKKTAAGAQGSRHLKKRINKFEVKASKASILKARKYLDELILLDGATVELKKPIGVDIPLLEWQILVLERKNLYLQSANSPLISTAMKEAEKHIPNNPRNEKRAYNQLCILIFILHMRKLLSSTSLLRPEQLGRWVAIKENWPETAAEIIRHPTVLHRLEIEASKKMGKIVSDATLEMSAIGAKTDPVFMEPLEKEKWDVFSARPKLSPVIDILINLE